MKDLISICITGVDGTGKSSVVKALNEYIGIEKSVIQYMGMKQWETKLALKCCKSNAPYIYRQIGRLAIIRELSYRVKKHKNEKKIVIFDRYADEQYLQYKCYEKSWKGRLGEALYKLFLIDLFYKPTLSVYLTCNIEDSLARKDDIVGKYEIGNLKKIKKVMDDYYYNKKGVLVIDTSYVNKEETLSAIVNKIGEMRCFSIMMN